MNVHKVKEMADIAHFYGATIKGELGHVGDNEGSAEGSSHLADPSQFLLTLSWRRILWTRRVLTR